MLVKYMGPSYLRLSNSWNDEQSGFAVVNTTVIVVRPHAQQHTSSLEVFPPEFLLTSSRSA